MIRALTGFATRNPWKVIAVWAVLGIALAVVGQAMIFRVTQTDTADFLPSSYDSAAAMRIATDQFGTKADANPVTVLVARTDGKPLSAADRQHIDDRTRQLGQTKVTMPKAKDPWQKDYSQIPQIGTTVPAPDGTFALLTVNLNGNSADPGLQNTFKAFRTSARTDFAAIGLRTGFTGALADQLDTDAADHNLTTIASACMTGLIVLIHILVFRSVLAALVPLLAVTVVGGAAAGAVVGTAQLTGIKLDPSVPSLINVVLLGIGIDYLLFMMFRFREQLRAAPDRHHRTVAAEVSGRVGTAVTSAALTIVAAFATLGIASFGQFRVLGPAIAVSVLVMLLAGLTLMPALLAACGRKLFWPSRALRRAPREEPWPGSVPPWHGGPWAWCSAASPSWACWPPDWPASPWTTGSAAAPAPAPRPSARRPRSPTRCPPAPRTRPPSTSRPLAAADSTPWCWTDWRATSARSRASGGSPSRCSARAGRRPGSTSS